MSAPQQAGGRRAAGEGRLVLELVGAAGPPIELPRAGVMTLGSARGKADLVLEGQGVADVHCAVGRLKGGGWAIKDLGSEHGTLVNGEGVQSARLAAGDQIVLGSRRLRVVDPARPAPAAPEATEPARPAGAPLPRVRGYRIERPLGRGGMGQVYLAVQESLARRVALKVLPERLSADADFVRRFQAEARAAAALNHPNVVTVHDVWEEEGRHWLAMEFMERGNLEARVAREGPLPWRDALEVLHDAAKGLVYAELRGIVHRDIKPANLMQNEVGTTKIADLGLATHLEAEATLAGDRRIYGTPHFISPEQARGERVDGRADLYSLGATMYRLLSGRTPFEGATTRDILRGHFTEEPRPLRQLAPEVPAELEAVVQRLMRKDPAERFPNAGALLQEVDRVRSHHLHGVGATLAAGHRKGPPLLLGGALLLVLAGAAAFVLLGGEEPGEPIAGGAVELPPGVPVPLQPAELPGAPEEAPPPAPTREPEPPPVDDDTALKRLDLRAESALRALPAELTPDERSRELLRLAREHAGSTWAARFEEEARALAQRGAQPQDAAAAPAAEGALQALRAAARTAEGEPRPLAEALEALKAVQPQPALEASPGFRAQQRALYLEVLEGALSEARAALAAAAELERTGAFEAVSAQLQQARRRLQAPRVAGLGELPPAARELPELEQVQALDRALAEQLEGLPQLRERFGRRRAREQQLALARGLGRGAAGLEGELRRLDLPAAVERLAALEARVEDPPTRALLAELRAELTAGRAALRALSREFAGGWKRRMLNDPRSRGRVHRDALAADEAGLLVDVGGGATERVAWSDFGGRTLELHQLFHERLTRPYTPEELRGIAALLRTAAVLQAVEEADEMFRPGQGNVLGDDEAAELLAGFEHARPWAELAGSVEALERERQAAQLLAKGLQAASADGWSLAVATLERLLDERADTLLVRLLSDGRGLGPPPLAAAAAQAPAGDGE